MRQLKFPRHISGNTRLSLSSFTECWSSVAWAGGQFSFPATTASAEEPIAAIGLEPGDAYSRRHFEPLEDFSGSMIDSPQLALVTFPGAIPELSVNPRRFMLLS